MSYIIRKEIECTFQKSQNLKMVKLTENRPILMSIPLNRLSVSQNQLWRLVVGHPVYHIKVIAAKCEYFVSRNNGHAIHDMNKNTT